MYIENTELQMYKYLFWENRLMSIYNSYKYTCPNIIEYFNWIEANKDAILCQLYIQSSRIYPCYRKEKLNEYEILSIS